jgi:hypothetical protein
MCNSTQSLPRDHSHPAGMHPSSKTGPSKKSAAEELTHTSAIPVTFIQPTDPSFSVGPKPSPDSLALNSTGQRQTNIYDSASEMVVVSSDPPALQGSLVPSVRLSPSTDHGRHPSPGSVPTFAWPVAPSLDHPPGDSTTVSLGAPVDLSVFDWNSIPNPLVETATLSTCHLPSLTYREGLFLGSDRSARISLYTKLRPRVVELRAS